jgi:hypothetical protein
MSRFSYSSVFDRLVPCRRTLAALSLATLWCGTPFKSEVAFASLGGVSAPFHEPWVHELQYCGRSFSHRHVRVTARSLLRGPNLLTGQMGNSNATAIEADERDAETSLITFPSGRSDQGFETFRWQVTAGGNQMTMPSANGNDHPQNLLRCV